MAVLGKGQASQQGGCPLSVLLLELTNQVGLQGCQLQTAQDPKGVGLATKTW